MSSSRTAGLIAGGAIVGILAVPSAAAAAPTRAEYIAQADPICHTTNDNVSQAAQGIREDKKSGRLKLAAKKLRRQGVLQGQGIDQLAPIEPPTADAQLIQSWLGMLQAQLPLVKRLAHDYAQGHVKTKAYRQLGKLISSTEALVSGFGFQYCQDM